MFALAGTTFILTQYFQLQVGYDPFGAGPRAVPVAVAIARTAPTSPQIARRIGEGATVGLGLTMLASGLTGMGLLAASNTYVVVLAGGILLGAGMGPTMAPASTALIRMVTDGEVTTRLARQVVDGVLAGEGEPAEIVAARGLAVVSDDSALQAAVDEALAAQPDVADKIRAGTVQAVGAIVGAVMTATRGQADAARVRELTVHTPGVAP